MTLGHMGQFVGQYPGQFLFAFQVHDHAREDKDIAAGHGKGVERIVQDYRGPEVERLRRQGLDQAVQQIFDVLAYFRVFDHGQAGADHHVEFVAHLLFIFDGNAAEKEGPRRHGKELR